MNVAVQELGLLRPRMFSYSQLLSQSLILPLFQNNLLNLGEITWQASSGEDDIEGKFIIASSIVSALYQQEIEENYMMIEEHGQTIQNKFKKFRALHLYTTLDPSERIELVDLVVSNLEETAQAFVISVLGLT